MFVSAGEFDVAYKRIKQDALKVCALQTLLDPWHPLHTLARRFAFTPTHPPTRLFPVVSRIFSLWLS